MICYTERNKNNRSEYVCTNYLLNIGVCFIGRSRIAEAIKRLKRNAISRITYFPSG